MIPGWLISVLTFPGIIAHEIGHVFFCKNFNVKIHKTCYFRFGNPAGYVVHDDPNNFKQSFFIDIGPFIVSNILAIFAFIFSIALMPDTEIYGLFFIWLGGSFAMNSFPSSGDAKALWNTTKKHSKENFLLKLIGYPFVLIIYIANILSFIWFDLIWAIILYSFVSNLL